MRSIVTLINAEDFLTLSQNKTAPILDVRSEGEFETGHIPASVNFPILTNIERHQVGLSYKNEGQAAAITLGQSLVAPHKLERTQQWLAYTKSVPQPIVECWRGGLRSRMAQDWLADAGATNVLRLRGGYKALRHELLRQMNLPFKGIIVMGYTGSGKTTFLHSLVGESKLFVLDLEGLANHRGSAFGKCGPQPSMQSFENSLGLELYRARLKPRLIVAEDESRSIGRVYLQQEYWAHHRAQECIFLESSLAERSHHTFKLYVENDILGTDSKIAYEKYRSAMDSIEKRLGNLLYQDIARQMFQAFHTRDPLQVELHSRWIESLLSHYYDKLYKFSLERSGRKPVFSGNQKALRDWLLSRH